MGVSVIIPCRNQASTLERAVKSAIAAGADEVLVFDDASTDDTQNLTIRLIEKYNWRVNMLITKVRMGVSVARNRMIECAIQDWIIPLDADDELLTIPKHMPLYGWGYGGWIEHYEDGREETFQASRPPVLKNKPICHATMLFSKALWQQVGGYDPDFFFGEDYAFQCALKGNGYPELYEYPLYKRYVGSNARTDKAMKYWPIIQEMAREKYPGAFI